MQQRPVTRFLSLAFALGGQCIFPRLHGVLEGVCTFAMTGRRAIHLVA